MVEVYSDEGISATSTKKRDGFNRMIADALDGKIDLIIDTALEAEHKEMKNEMSVVAELIQKCVNENAHIKLDQEKYRKRYEGLVTRFEAAKERFNEISEHQQEIKVRHERVEAFLHTLIEQDELITEFEEWLWHTLVDRVTVFSENDIRFTFKDGSTF